MIAYLSLFSIPLEQWLGVFISYVIYNVLRFVFLFLFGTCVVKRGLLQIASLFFIPTSINDKVTISPYTAACSDQGWMTCTTTYGL